MISSEPGINSTKALSDFWHSMANLRESPGGLGLWGGAGPRELICRQIVEITPKPVRL